jgi:hypothetical protein
MVYLSTRVVVPKLTDATVVRGGELTALPAPLAGWLRVSAEHTQHALDGLTIECMFFGLVVAVSARIPFVTVGALDLDIAYVVRTAKWLFFVLVFGSGIFYTRRDRPIGGLEINVGEG